MEPSKKYTIPSVLLIHYYVFKIQILKKIILLYFPTTRKMSLRAMTWQGSLFLMMPQITYIIIIF